MNSEYREIEGIAVGRMFSDGQVFEEQEILFLNNKILEIGSREPGKAKAEGILDFSEMIALPGLIDLQVNGGGGIMFNDATSDADIMKILCAHAATGSTSICATLISDKLEHLEDKIEMLSNLSQNRKTNLADEGNLIAEIVGVHVEGPFLAPSKRGGHSEEYLLEPSLAACQRIVGESGLVKILTLAPELPNAKQVIDYLNKKGVISSLGHSNAGFNEVLEAIDGGLQMGTHLFNAMTQFGSRDPGAVGAFLKSVNVPCGLICDGKHVHPFSLSTVFDIKGTENCFLVTDAVSPLGTNEPSFLLYGHEVTIKNGGCYTADGTLAGSATTLLKGVENAIKLCGVPIEDAVAMATSKPAKILGLNSRGDIKKGNFADIIIVDEEFQLHAVIKNGRVSFDVFNL